MTDPSTTAGYAVADELTHTVDAPIYAEIHDHASLCSPTFDRAKPFVRIIPGAYEICVSAVTCDGVLGERVGQAIAVDYPDWRDPASILSDDYRAAVRAAVDAKLAEIAAVAA